MVRLLVPEMHCEACKTSVEKALGPLAVPGGVTVDLATRQVSVEGQADATRMIAALDRIGFAATVAV